MSTPTIDDLSYYAPQQFETAARRITEGSKVWYYDTDFIPYGYPSPSEEAKPSASSHHSADWIESFKHVLSRSNSSRSLKVDADAPPSYQSVMAADRKLTVKHARDEHDLSYHLIYATRFLHHLQSKLSTRYNHDRLTRS